MTLRALRTFLRAAFRRPRPSAFGHLWQYCAGCGLGGGFYDATGRVYLDWTGGLLGAKLVWICEDCHDAGRGSLLPQVSCAPDDEIRAKIAKANPGWYIRGVTDWKRP